MKFFGFLIFLTLAVLMASAMAKDEVDPKEVCKEKCHELPYNPVCGSGKGKATYWNDCEMKCDGAKPIHRGVCEPNDLIDNQGINNGF